MAANATEIGIKQTCIAAVLLRVLFMIYGEWQDANMVVKYTDIDYEVFTDAAEHVAAGRSPYKRATYRYTPLLAMLLVPNITLHKAFGKLLFVACDICAGYLIYVMLKTQKVEKSLALTCSWLWFFNPLIITVSTRGNAESVLAVLVLSTLYFMLNKQFTLSAIMLAFSVHFKIYPAIYALPLYLNVGWLAKVEAKVNKPTQSTSADEHGLLRVIWGYLSHPKQLKFAVISGATFLLINFVMYNL